MDLQAIDVPASSASEVVGPDMLANPVLQAGDALLLEPSLLEPSVDAPVVRDRSRRHSRRHERALLRASLTVDALMLGAAAATAEMGAARAGVPGTPSIWLLVFPVVVMLLLRARKLYAPRLSLRVLDDVRTIVAATTIAAMAVLSFRALLTAEPAAAQQGLRLWAFAIVYLVAGRALLFWSEVAARRRGETLRPTLIIGAGHVGRLAANRMLAYPELGLRPVGFLDKDARANDGDEGSPPVLGASWDLERVVEEHEIEQVVVTFSKAPHGVLLRLARQCEELGVRIAFVPRLFDRMTEQVRVEHVVGLPLLTADLVDPKGWQFAVKHAIDRVAAAVLLLLTLPALAAAAVAVRISLGRPVVFRQRRVGRDERPFEMLKFRTLKGLPSGADLDAIAPPERRTQVGELLRRTSLDELPQLINVLRGEMSLVGPRPERPELIHLFAGRVNRYEDRHRVKAGISGWAQIQGVGRGAGRFGDVSMSERIEWDNRYIQNWSLWLDLKILLLTILAVLRFRQSA